MGKICVSLLLLGMLFDTCFSLCNWLPWVNRDGPSQTRDAEFYETPNFKCEVEKYQVSLVSGGPVYNDLSSVPHNKLVWEQWEDFQGVQGISCINKKQKKCKVDSIGWKQGPSPPCCMDYKIRFCCKVLSTTTTTTVDAMAIGDGGSCCVKKTVGGVAYTLVSENDTTMYGCEENCIYTRDDQPGGTQICFRAGDLESVCNPDKDGTIVFEKEEEFILTRNNKLGEVDFLGKEYSITFQLLLTAGTPATSSANAGSIIHFTVGGNYGVYGDRTPALWVYKGTEIVLRSAIDGQDNYYDFPDLPAISLNTWHTVEISQLSNGSEIVFNMKLDGSTIATKINNQPRSFKNVKIFAGDDWFPAAFGKMKNLIVKTKL